MSCPQSICALLLSNLFLKIHNACLKETKITHKKTEQKTSKTSEVDNTTTENSI